MKFHSALFLAALVAVATPVVARAGVFDGYLAECTAVTATTCTEIATTGYNRQAITFNGLAGGLVTSGNYYSFSQSGTGGATIAGRAVYDAATGGNLLAVIPVATSVVLPTYGDRGSPGSLQFTLTGYSGVYSADAISANWLAGTTIGTAPDGSSVSVGVNVQMGRGKAAAYVGGLDPLYSVGNVQTTGFAVTIPNGISTYGIGGAGTLATGAVSLSATPGDGQIQRLFCDVTVTTLTLTAPSTYSFIGTAPTTCGPNAAHEFQYFVAAKKVRVLF
jgi:hypothetical protein